MACSALWNIARHDHPSARVMRTKFPGIGPTSLSGSAWRVRKEMTAASGCVCVDGRTQFSVPVAPSLARTSIERHFEADNRAGVLNGSRAFESRQRKSRQALHLTAADLSK